MKEQTITVGLGDRSYPIVIGQGIVPRIGADLQSLDIGKRYGIISDTNVAELYADSLLDSLTNAGVECELLVFEAGEASKHSATVVELCRELARRGFDRGDALIALGGGVVGDITGFLASIYMRGIPFVQVPTSLLAQVDSSVGGKTGVDIPEGKNLVGTFYQPKAVYIDIDVLSSLPKEEYLGGLAEVIKYGVIVDADFFEFLAANRQPILQLEPEVVIPMIRTCCEIKAQVVERDEREGGLRRILNFGHTIGHAVEAASKYTIIHGLAVSIGMKAACELAMRGGYCDQATVNRVSEILAAYDLPTDIPRHLDRGTIKSYLKSDKKTVGGRVFFVLPETVGRVIVTDQVDGIDVDNVLGL